MTLELPDQSLIVQIPHGNITITATAKAHLRVGADGQCIASGGCGSQLGLNTWRGTGQIPDGQIGRLPTHNQRPSVRQELHRPNVVVRLQAHQLTDRLLGIRNGNVPHFHASLATRVHVLGGIRDGHRTHHLAVRQCADLSGMSWNSRTVQGVCRELYRS